jgi:hypothetical protein
LGTRHAWGMKEHGAEKLTHTQGGTMEERDLE